MATNDKEVLYASSTGAYRVLGIKPDTTLRSQAGKLASTGVVFETPRARCAFFGREALTVLKEFQAAMQILLLKDKQETRFKVWLEHYVQSLQNNKVVPRLEAEVAEFMGQ
jgi:hypothetical protein